MNILKQTLSFIIVMIMLLTLVPIAAFAQNEYTVVLHAGPEGQGGTYTLTKAAGEPLDLAHLRAEITSNYGFEPKGGNSDQRVFIMWAEGYNATTARGTGKTYFESYNEDHDIELYAIWGYPVMYNADGGRFADGSTKKLDYVVNYAEWNGEATDPKSMYRYSMPDWNGDVPTKEGARRVGNDAGPGSKGYAYGLIRSDGVGFFTWEGYGENLTIPPKGGAYYPSGNHNGATWDMFLCIPADHPDNPYDAPIIEFLAIWEPSVTYDPNGGQGESYSEYMTFDWAVAKYETYTIDKNSFTREGAKFKGWNTKPDGSGRAFSAGRRITNTPTRDSNGFTLYAQWEIEHEHDYNTVITDATCSTEGTAVHTCIICGHSYTETTAPTYNHSYTTVTTEPTCGETGITVYTCTDCGYSYSETLPPSGDHTYDITIIEPTCKIGGSTVYNCKVCSVSYAEPIPATGEHSYSDWSVFVEPTYFIEGQQERYCIVCGIRDVQSIPIKEYVNEFTDVQKNHWFYDEVEYCVKRGYVSGMTETTFLPNNNLTRAQFITLLAKLDGVELSLYEGRESGFKDVKTNHWWNSAICWAVENGYTSGISADMFGPNNNITREQLARFFYVYTEKNGSDVSPRAELNDYSDNATVSTWARESVEWAVAKGLITGISETVLSPRGNATRAQAARIFMVYNEIR